MTFYSNIFLLGASSSVSALYSRLNSLKRVAFVCVCKPQRAKTHFLNQTPGVFVGPKLAYPP